MKTRNSLVSNSSSTSFVVTASEKEQAIKDGLKLIPISELKNIRQRLSDLGADFIISADYIWNHLDGMDGTSFITEPYDRDDAYRQDFTYSEFITDL